MRLSMALMGSGEFEPWAEDLDRQLIEASGAGGDRVVILPTASAPEGEEVFERWARMGTEHYRQVGAQPQVLPIKTREDAMRGEFVSALAGAALVFFSGGNPAHLVRVLEGTPFWTAVLAAIDAGTSFGGCSAGVSMLGGITPDTSKLTFTSRMWIDGLKVFPNVLFGLHWNALDNYHPGARQFILGSVPDGSIFVGIDERTAIVGDGSTFRVEGSGTAMLRLPGGEDRIFQPGETLLLPG